MKYCKLTFSGFFFHYLPLSYLTYHNIVDVYQPECDSLKIFSSGKAGGKYPEAMGTYKLIPGLGIGSYDVDSPLFKHTYNEYYLVYKAYYGGMKRWEVSNLIDV